MKRLLSGAVMLPLLWVMIKMAPSWAFLVVALVVISISCWECLRMLDTGESRPFKGLTLVACWLVLWSFTRRDPSLAGHWLAAWLPFDAGAAIVAASIGAVLASMWLRPDPGSMLQSSMRTVFPVLFVALAQGYVVGLYGMEGEDGRDLLLLLFFCVIASDIAAYYFGTRFGRHAVAPRLSPKKSWEGVAAGLAASIGVGVVAHLWFYQRLPLVHAMLLGLILGMTGVLGDLAESMVKRAAGVKDSSGLIPGHGGMLDRTDSLLFSAPVLYYYYSAFL